MNNEQNNDASNEMSRGHKHGRKRGFKIAAFALIALGVLPLVVMSLWNWLMPALFVGAVSSINYLQALALLILSKILFGGFNGRRGHHGRCGHRGQGGCHGHGHAQFGPRARWASMSEEERAQFRAKMKERCGQKSKE